MSAACSRCAAPRPVSNPAVRTSALLRDQRDQVRRRTRARGSPAGQRHIPARYVHRALATATLAPEEVVTGQAPYPISMVAGIYRKPRWWARSHLRLPEPR